MKWLPPLIAFLLCTGTAYPQKNKAVIDSLEKLVAVQKDSALIKTYNELTWEYRLVDRGKAMDYGNKAIALGNQIKYPKGIAQAYNDMGIIAADKENYDSAILLYNQAMEIRRKMNDELGIAKLYSKIGVIYQKQGLFGDALEQQFKALDLFQKFGDQKSISYTLNNIGILNQNMGRLDEAIKYQEQSIVIKEKIKDNLGLAGSYVNVGNIYLLQNNTAKAESYYSKAITISRTIDDKEYLSNALNNMGNLYTKTKQLDKAVAVVTESMSLRQVLGDTKGTVSCLNNLGEVFIQQKQIDSAKKVLSKALQLGKTAVNCKPEVNKVYLTFSKLYEAAGDTAQALDMYKLYASTKDSLYTDEMGERFAELETKYKTLEKEKTIQQQEFAISRKNYWIAGISGILILGSLLAYSYYRRYQLKQKAKLQQTIMTQQEQATKAVLEAEENERQRIAKDLHDGVGQMMSAAKMNLSAFESELKLSDKDQQLSFEKIIQLVDESCKEVRQVSHNMMPNALLKNSLAAAVREFLDKLDQKTLQVSLYTEGLDQRLDSNSETVLYRVIQECVNNVIKHSGANKMDISLIKDKDGISCTVEDNGKGFETGDKEKAEGIGLKNIRTRVEYLKGTVDFDSSPGKGTLVAVHIPVSSVK